MCLVKSDQSCLSERLIPYHKGTVQYLEHQSTADDRMDFKALLRHSIRSCSDVKTNTCKITQRSNHRPDLQCRGWKITAQNWYRSQLRGQRYILQLH